MHKIIRTICYFTNEPGGKTLARLSEISDCLIQDGYEIQTNRVCSPAIEKIKELDSSFSDDYHCFSVGTLDRTEILEQLNNLGMTRDVSFNLDLTQSDINQSDTQILFEIIRKAPAKTFNFTYVFNNPPSTPYFPSGNYVGEGFSIGLQPTDLSVDCDSLEEWLFRIGEVLNEINRIFSKEQDFLGIDSSIAPLFEGRSSLIYFLRRIGYDFNYSVTTDIFLRMADFIKKENPRPIGLCGLMFPCLEDFGLAEEYEKGNFSIERNVFLSLHSGLGIDTYPIGIDESPEKVLDILRLVQGLSNKYKKPLSIRFVSDGKTKIGERTDFQNQYLKDVVVRGL